MDLDTPSLAHPIALDTIFGPVPYFSAVDTTVTAFDLYVDPTKTESTIVLQHAGVYDTLVLGYTNQSIVLSPDCGAALFQDNLEVKYSTFDSVRIVSRQLLTSVKVNIEIRL
jgi:hypothetical protein